MTAKLATEIIRSLRGRRDVWLDESVGGTGCPDIRGNILKRVIETEIRGRDSYHPFNYSGYFYYGQSFAIEVELRKGEKPLTKEQLAWRVDYERAGGLYIEARTMEDVWDVLGRQEPQPWLQYEQRITKIGTVLNAQG